MNACAASHCACVMMAGMALPLWVTTPSDASLRTIIVAERISLGWLNESVRHKYESCQILPN